MAYKDGFVIEYDDTISKSVNCRDCIYYDKSDRSCSKKGFYHPEDGYFHWKTCEDFMLSGNNYDKVEKVIKQKGMKYVPKKLRASHSVNRTNGLSSPKSSNDVKNKQYSTEYAKNNPYNKYSDKIQKRSIKAEDFEKMTGKSLKISKAEYKKQSNNSKKKK